MLETLSTTLQYLSSIQIFKNPEWVDCIPDSKQRQRVEVGPRTAHTLADLHQCVDSGVMLVGNYTEFKLWQNSISLSVNETRSVWTKSDTFAFSYRPHQYR